MIIAVDFDGTIVEHDYPRIGKPIPFAIETLLELQKDHHILILWTVRDGNLLQEAIDYCAKRGLHFYAANKNHPEEDPAKASRKLGVDLFIDDRNIGGLPEWGIIYRVITATSRRDYSFEDILSSSANAYRKTKKKNFFIRLGEMIEKGG